MQRLPGGGRIILLLAAAVAPQVAYGGPALLDKAIAEWAETIKAPAYGYSLTDLNDDSVPDAVVLLKDLKYCGSGGCTMVVLLGMPSGFQYVSRTTIMREPIAVLAETCHGWHTLAVLVSGGGAIPGQALLRFDGTEYPLNPSMQPRAAPEDLQVSVVLELLQ